MSARCPYCGTAPVYVSLSTVECSNEKCVKYSSVTYPKALSEPMTQADGQDDEQPDDGQVYYWVNHHHDFGD